MGSLNPYSAGSETVGTTKAKTRTGITVLILILLEVRLLAV